MAANMQQILSDETAIDPACPVSGGCGATGPYPDDSMLNGIPAAYFGMHEATQNNPWPTVGFGSLRFWDDGATWCDLQQGGSGTWSWSKFNGWLDTIQPLGIDALYTFGDTPGWVHGDTGCQNTNNPPSDVHSGDTDFKNFVTGVVNHALNRDPGVVHYYEIWNEANLHPTVTVSDLLIMTADANAIIRSLDPTAKIMAPSMFIADDSGTFNFKTFMNSYLGGGADQYLDGYDVHTYPGGNFAAEAILANLTEFTTLLANNGVSSAKPIIDSEFSWGGTFTNDPDMRKAFTARSFLIYWASGIQRAYWYKYDSTGDVGELWVPKGQQYDNGPTCNTNGGCYTGPYYAYQQVNAWMVGSQMTRLCGATGGLMNIWTCGLVDNTGRQTLAVWDTAQSCSGGTCTTSNYTVGSQYRAYMTVDSSTVYPISGRVVAIGAKPILLIPTAP